MKIVFIISLILIAFLLFQKRNRGRKKTLKFGENIDKTRIRRRAKELRMEKHTRIWVVLRYMVTYHQLVNSTDFHSYEKFKGYYEEALGRIRKEPIERSDIKTVIRFCQFEHFYGICQHKLSAEEIEALYNWHDIHIDEEKLLSNILKSYQAYWDNVLNSYKRPSARNNRLSYLIDNLDEIIKKPFMQEFPNIKTKAQLLQSHYKQLSNG